MGIHRAVMPIFGQQMAASYFAGLGLSQMEDSNPSSPAHRNLRKVITDLANSHDPAVSDDFVVEQLRSMAHACQAGYVIINVTIAQSAADLEVLSP